jgi:hypothetical protein
MTAPAAVVLAVLRVGRLQRGLNQTLETQSRGQVGQVVVEHPGHYQLAPVPGHRLSEPPLKQGHAVGQYHLADTGREHRRVQGYRERAAGGVHLHRAFCRQAFWAIKPSCCACRGILTATAIWFLRR